MRTSKFSLQHQNNIKEDNSFFPIEFVFVVQGDALFCLHQKGLNNFLGLYLNVHFPSLWPFCEFTFSVINLDYFLLPGADNYLYINDYIYYKQILLFVRINRAFKDFP